MSTIRRAEPNEIRCKDCKHCRQWAYGYYECAKPPRHARIEKYYTCDDAEAREVNDSPQTI